MPRQERPVLAEVLEVLARHVGLDAGVDARVEKLLEQIARLGVIVVLHDHHRADHGDDLRSRKEFREREDLLGVRQRQPVDEAVFPREAQHHHDLAGVVRVGVDHDVAADDCGERLQPLVAFGDRALAGGVGILPIQVLLRPPEMVVRGRVPAHDRLRGLARAEIDERPHRHLQVDVRLEDHVRAGAALHLQRHRLAAGDDAAAGSRDHRGDTAGQRDLDHGVVEVEVLDGLPLGGDGSGNARPAGTVQREVGVRVDHPRDDDGGFVQFRVGGGRDVRAHRGDDAVPDQDLAVPDGAVGDGVDGCRADEDGAGQELAHIQQHDVVAPAQFPQERSLVSRAVRQQKSRALALVFVQRALDVRPV